MNGGEIGGKIEVSLGSGSQVWGSWVGRVVVRR